MKLIIIIEVKSWISWSKAFTCRSKFQVCSKAIRGNCLQGKIFEKIGPVHNRCDAWHDNQDDMANLVMTF